MTINQNFRLTGEMFYVFRKPTSRLIICPFFDPQFIILIKYFWLQTKKSETNWNQINQINRRTYFCLTQHEASLYRTPNYLMENQKQSKSIQYCSNLLYTFHGKKVFDDGDLHICTLLQQQHYCFTTRIHLKKKLMFDSLRRFIDSWSNFVSFSLGLNLLFERKSISKHILNTG